MLKKIKNKNIITLLLVCTFMLQLNGIKVQAVEVDKSDVIEEIQGQIFKAEENNDNSKIIKESYEQEIEIENKSVENDERTSVKDDIKINSFSAESNKFYPNLYRNDGISLKMNITSKYYINEIIVTYGSKYHNYSNFNIYLYNYSSIDGNIKGSGVPNSYTLGENEVKEVRINVDGNEIKFSKEELQVDKNINLEALTIDVKPYIPIVNANNKEVKAGESIKISTDLSTYPYEISEVRLIYENVSTMTSVVLEMKYNKTTKKFEALYEASNLSESGKLILRHVEIVDKDGYYQYIYNDGYDINLSSGNFYVNNDVMKFIYPMKVSVNKDEINIKDNVKVSISGFNLVNGNVTAEYINIKNDEKKYLNFVYNSKNSKWEDDFTSSNQLDLGLWAINSLTLVEKKEAGNVYLTVYNKELNNSRYTKDFSKADILVDESVGSKTLPKISGSINNKTTTIEGTAEANDIVIIEKEVKVFAGVRIEEIARTVADIKGKFKVNIPMQAVNTNLGIKAVDKFGNESDYVNITVKNINREDVNYDSLIDIVDIALVARQYNSINGDEGWDEDLDVNEDEVVDIFDITLVSKKL